MANELDGYLLVNYRQPYPLKEDGDELTASKFTFAAMRFWNIKDGILQIESEDKRVLIPSTSFDRVTVVFNSHEERTG